MSIEQVKLELRALILEKLSELDYQEQLERLSLDLETIIEKEVNSLEIDQLLTLTKEL